MSVRNITTPETPPVLPDICYEGIAGIGGMSVVYRAFHKGMHKPVAVKVMHREFTKSGRDVRQFMTEVRMMCRLNHPSIVHGYEADVSDGQYWFIMDYVDGYNFSDYLKRKQKIKQNDGIIICESVANALQYAWQETHLVHCDLKPDNLMVDRDGTIKIMDLGLCHVADSKPSENIVPPEEFIGTPAYISPEQIYGDVTLDCRADIYSLGASLYHLLTGRLLFPLINNDDILRSHVDDDSAAPDPRDIVPTIIAPLAQLLANMLTKNRDYRYQSWNDVLHDVLLVERNEPIASLSDAPSSIALNR